MKNENTEGKVSNTCVYIKLKTYSGIQEMNFCFLLQVCFFFWLILAEGFVLPELYVILLCFVEESMKDMNSYV